MLDSGAWALPYRGGGLLLVVSRIPMLVEVLSMKVPIGLFELGAGVLRWFLLIV